MFTRRLESREGAKRRRRAIKIRLILLSVFSLVLIGGSLWGLWQEEIRITNVTLIGAPDSLHNEIQHTVLNVLWGTYGYVIPKAIALWYPKEEIQNALRKKYSRFSEVTVAHMGRSVVITFTERTPEALWCGVSRDVPVSSCLMLDATGLTFDIAPPILQETECTPNCDQNGCLSATLSACKVPNDLRGEITMNNLVRYFGPLTVDQRYEGDPNEKEGRPGMRLLSEGEFSTLLSFVNDRRVRALFYATSVSIQDDDASLQDASGAELLINRRLPFAETLNNLETVLNAEVYIADLKKHSGLKRLDLRFSNKAFYTFW